jgi:hypothetical protein
MPLSDALLVPGGGVRAGGALPSWVRVRLDRARELYSGEFIITLSAGTPHRPPPLDDEGFPILESVAAARRLIESGIPADRILIETSSYDTIGNAFFAKVIHTDPLGLRRLRIITSDFHAARTQAAFEWVYSLAPNGAEYELKVEPVEDPELDPALRRARSAKEEASLAELRRLAGHIHSWRDLHLWLFTRHGAYAPAKTRERPDIDRAADSTY